MTTPVIISVLALMLSGFSLSWQWWSWRHSGPVLRVRSTHEFPKDDQGRDYHCIAVSVINRGRAAATVKSWGIEFPSGASLVGSPSEPASDKLPARVESHASASFYVMESSVLEHAEEEGVPYKKLRPWIQVATGKKVYARKGVPEL